MGFFREQNRRAEERAQRPLRSQAGISLGVAALALGAALPAQAQVIVQPAPQPGSLYLSDYFESKMPDQMSHGETVERSARQFGFEGPIIRQEVRENPYVKKSHRFEVRLDNGTFTAEEMQKKLSEYAENCQVGQLQTATDDLKMWLDQGVHQSAINLSRGCGQYQVVDNVYKLVKPAWSSYDQREQIMAKRRLEKIAIGLGSDVSAMLSTNAAVSGPARQQFQQSLIDHMSLASQNSPLLAQSQQDYDQVVAQLAQSKVSVVVAAANSGQLTQEMAKDAHGLEVKLPQGFWNNRLASPATVSVGALEMSDSRVAGYTNPDSGIDFFADGDAKVDPKNPDRLVNIGTSFANPRTASILTELHKKYPDWSTEQVQQEAERLATELGDYGGYVVAPVIRTDSAREFFKR